MNSRQEEREERFKRLERFNYTIKTSIQFTIFAKPEHPTPELETQLSRITDSSDTSHLEESVQEFNTRFAPCEIKYLLESTTAPGESNTTGYSHAEAMGKLADELKMSEEFDAACIAVDETNNPEPYYKFQVKLMEAFGVRWAKENEAATRVKLTELGFFDALESQDREGMVTLMSEMQKPVSLAFWNRINELTGNAMDQATITKLAAETTELGKNAIKEKVDEFFAQNTSGPRV